jgi:hypothetical protein
VAVSVAGISRTILVEGLGVGEVTSLFITDVINIEDVTVVGNVEGMSEI